MNPFVRIVVPVIVIAATAAGAALAAFPTINPRLRGLDLVTTSYVKVPATSTVTVPKAFLDKSHLFGAMVEACTDNYLTLGAGAGPYRVRWTVEGDHALMLLDKRNLVPNIGGSSEDALNRFPMREAGDNVELDLAHPELNGLDLVVEDSPYKAQRPGYIYDVVQEPGFLSWGEKFIAKAAGPGDGPSQMTVAIKFYLKEATPSATYHAKPYPPEDAERYGFFTTTVDRKLENGLVKPMDLVNRWDLTKKITYLLHPSIPQQYRETFRQCVLSWNKVFKRTNGVEPIECKDGTDDQLPGDLRAHVLYWVDYPTPYGNGAIGPSSADPDTGEMLDGDVIFYADSYRQSIARLRKIAAAEQALAQPDGGKAPGDARQVDLEEAMKGLKVPNPHRNRTFTLKMGPGGGMTFSPRCEFPLDEAAKVATMAHSDITQMTDEQVLTRMIRETVPHEVGHTLGLRHNFKATADLKNIAGDDDSTSVMDYEIDLQANLEPGPYDVAAIAYGYDGDKGLHEGKDYYYATDGSEATDPLSNQWDSGDVLGFYTGRFNHMRKLRDGELFSSMAAYARNQLATLSVVRKFVGGDDQDQSQKAFDFLTKVLASRTPQPPFNAIERRVAMVVLTNPSRDLEPLDEKQRATLGGALAANVLSDGPDDYGTRLAALDALKGMNDIYGYNGLQAVAQSYQKASGGAAGATPLPAREQELALRVQSALASYFHN